MRYAPPSRTADNTLEICPFDRIGCKQTVILTFVMFHHKPRQPRSCTIRLKDMQAAAEKGTPMTVIIGDIDYFKTFNDRFGHACGDKVLKAVSGIMTRTAGEDAVVSRWGGEEFLLAFGGREYDEVLDILSCLYEEIRTYNMAFGNDNLSITMTFGIQEYKSGMTTDDVINLADHKLYYGKNHGRDCIVDKIPSEINM